MKVIRIVLMRILVFLWGHRHGKRKEVPILTSPTISRICIWVGDAYPLPQTKEGTMRLFVAYFLSSLLFFVSIDVNAKILFGSHHTHGNWNIYVMDDDGSNITLLTNEGGVWAPQWSPDGTSIVFTRGASLWLMNADGTDIRRILDSPQFTDETYPSFSPDGKYFANSYSLRINAEYLYSALIPSTIDLKEIVMNNWNWNSSEDFNTATTL